jgi:predicted dehydrogenase
MEDEAVGIVAARMKSGAIANMSINWRTRSHAAKDGLWYELTQACGIDGEAYYMSGKGTYVLVHKSKGGKMPFEYESEAEESGPAGFKKVKSGEWRGHVGCIREWIKSLRGEEARILTSGRDVRGTVEVAEAAYISEKEGRTVALPVEPKPWVSNKDRERGE